MSDAIFMQFASFMLKIQIDLFLFDETIQQQTQGKKKTPGLLNPGAGKSAFLLFNANSLLPRIPIIMFENASFFTNTTLANLLKNS
jgi:hypothetical protein